VLLVTVKTSAFGNNSFRELYPNLLAKEAFQDVIIVERLNCCNDTPTPS
jgi:hypothetical protein